MFYAVQTEKFGKLVHAFDSKAQRDYFTSSGIRFASIGEKRFWDIALREGGFELHRIGCASKYITI